MFRRVAVDAAVGCMLLKKNYFIFGSQNPRCLLSADCWLAQRRLRRTNLLLKTQGPATRQAHSTLASLPEPWCAAFSLREVPG